MGVPCEIKTTISISKSFSHLGSETLNYYINNVRGMVSPNEMR